MEPSIPMTKRKAALPDVRRSAVVQKNIKTDSASRFDGPALLPGENRETLEGIAQSLREHIQPRDPLEEIYFDDLLEAQWNKLRYRSAKSNLLRSSAYRGVEKLVTPLVDTTQLSLDAATLENPADPLVRLWNKGDPSAREEVRELLERAGHDEGAILAQTVFVLIEEMKKIEKFISVAEARFNAAIRNINDHRAMLALIRPQAITDADYKELENVETTE